MHKAKGVWGLNTKIRTDLATEIHESNKEDNGINGVVVKTEKQQNCIISEICINSDEGARVMGKPVGKYISIETSQCVNMEESETEKVIEILCKQLKRMNRLMCNGDFPSPIMVAGIGNRNITSDSVGPRTVEQLNITSHIKKYFPDESNEMGSLCAIIPGVMAQTGMETGDIIKGICNNAKPQLVIVIDALASRSMDRINATFQLSGTGISPGSGLGNERKRIDEEFLGVPVMSIGVPTVVEARTIVLESIEQLMDKSGEGEVNRIFSKLDLGDVSDKYVTTKNIDEEVVCISRIISEAINRVYVEKK